jgi:hypothetical protein
MQRGEREGKEEEENKFSHAKPPTPSNSALFILHFKVKSFFHALSYHSKLILFVKTICWWL